MTVTGRRHVVVIGGGVAGMAAAYTVRSTSPDDPFVSVLTADRRFVGKLHTTPFAGRMVDEGADAFLLRVPWAIDLCRALGVTDDELVHPAARTAYVWSRGGLHGLPPQHMGVPTDLDALAASGLISPAGVERARRDLTDPAGPPLTADRDIASVVEARLGREVLERMVDPLVGGINAGDTERLSIDTVVPQIAAAARDRDHPSLIEACRAQQSRALAAAAGQPDRPIFASPVGGMQDLIGRMDLAVDASGQADRYLDCRVESIEPIAGGQQWSVHVAGRESLVADAVVVAAPAFAAGPMLHEVAPVAAATLADIDYASVAIVTLAFRPEDIDHPLDRSGFLVPRVEPTEALSACSWSSTKWAHLAPEHGDGTVVLRASAGRSGAEAALDQDDDDLVAALLDDLAMTMGVHGAPTEVRVSRWPRSLPQYRPGHLDRIAAAEAALPPTIALAGAALRGVGVPACIHSGTEAAEKLTRFFVRHAS